MHTANVEHSNEDGASEMTSDENSASVTSHLQELDNCIHDQPAADRRQSNSDTVSKLTLCQTEPDEFLGYTDASSVRSEGQRASSSETMDGSEATVSDVRKQNTNDTDIIEIRTKPLLEHRINHDSLLASDKVSVTDKRPVKFELYEGIGPTDEDTGIPIASRTVSKT